jgi:hypothetical protein
MTTLNRLEPTVRSNCKLPDSSMGTQFTAAASNNIQSVSTNDSTIPTASGKHSQSNTEKLNLLQRLKQHTVEHLPLKLIDIVSFPLDLANPHLFRGLTSVMVFLPPQFHDSPEIILEPGYYKIRANRLDTTNPLHQTCYYAAKYLEKCQEDNNKNERELTRNILLESAKCVNAQFFSTKRSRASEYAEKLQETKAEIREDKASLILQQQIDFQTILKIPREKRHEIEEDIMSPAGSCQDIYCGKQCVINPRDLNPSDLENMLYRIVYKGRLYLPQGKILEEYMKLQRFSQRATEIALTWASKEGRDFLEVYKQPLKNPPAIPPGTWDYDEFCMLKAAKAEQDIKMKDELIAKLWQDLQPLIENY